MKILKKINIENIKEDIQIQNNEKFDDYVNRINTNIEKTLENEIDKKIIIQKWYRCFICRTKF